jgi:hypothetical protein
MTVCAVSVHRYARDADVQSQWVPVGPSSRRPE